MRAGKKGHEKEKDASVGTGENGLAGVSDEGVRERFRYSQILGYLQVVGNTLMATVISEKELRTTKA